MQDVFLNGDNIDAAISRGFRLSVDTWGASASLVVDPINLNLPLGGQTIGLRDSSFAIAANLRSKGSFSSTAANMSVTDPSPLLCPDLTVPLSAEIILDIIVGDVVVSPM